MLINDDWKVMYEAAERDIAELRAKLDAAREDSKRLDWMERRRLALNRHYGTEYGWKFVASHNVNRLFVNSTADIDLNDAEAKGPDVRSAIDVAMKERP